VKPLLVLVEDEPALARGLVDNLRDDGYEVRLVARGDEALAAIRAHRPQAVVLDILLPGRSGLEVLKDLRRGGDRVPVLMLTARSEVVDRVLGLELGADDYLPKPFAVRELLARVRALLRRAEPQPRSTSEITLCGVRFDFRSLTATGSRGRLDLTPHDILVLKILAEQRGDVVARIDIIEDVCGLDSEATLRTVDNHVVALRRAIGDDPRRPCWIQTVKGAGYRLTRDDDA
jgi:DNA-binding response OmpR family regulator